MDDGTRRARPAHRKAALLCGLLFVLAALLPWVAQPAALVGAEGVADGFTEPGPGINAQPVASWPPLETHPLDLRPILVLDAGHGGVYPTGDPGALSRDGKIYESTVTLAMALRVQALLAQHEDELQVVMTRTQDVFLSPMERTNPAAQLQANLFLSLHLNADTSAKVRGFSCYPTPPGRLNYAESVEFAQLLVERVRPTGIPIAGTNGIWFAYYRPSGTGYYKQLMDWAEVDPQNPGGDESFGVVEYTGCPSVLIEQWYITNDADMALFNHERGYDNMAQCIYLAICDYFGLQPKE